MYAAFLWQRFSLALSSARPCFPRSFGPLVRTFVPGLPQVPSALAGHTRVLHGSPTITHPGCVLALCPLSHQRPTCILGILVCMLESLPLSFTFSLFPPCLPSLWLAGCLPFFPLGLSRSSFFRLPPRGFICAACIFRDIAERRLAPPSRLLQRFLLPSPRRTCPRCGLGV